MFNPATNITEQIADHLADLVVRNELGGGARIQELKVAHELGVSRGSVREALLILERRHLIEIVPRRGAVVNELFADEAIELVDTLLANQQRLLHQLIASDALGSVLARGEEAVLLMEQSARENDIRKTMRGRLQFFVALQLNLSRYTRAMFACLLPTSQRLIYYLLGHSNIDLHDLARFYRALYDALEARDCTRMEELLLGYQHRLHRLIRDALQQVGSQKRYQSSTNGYSIKRVSASS